MLLNPAVDTAVGVKVPTLVDSWLYLFVVYLSFIALSCAKYASFCSFDSVPSLFKVVPVKPFPNLTIGLSEYFLKVSAYLNIPVAGDFWSKGIFNCSGLPTKPFNVL